MAARGHVLDGETLIGLAVDEKGGDSELRIEPHIAALQRKLGPASRWIQEVSGAGYAYCAPDLHSPRA
jgi:DNA-binding response OmpR family regulator